MAIPSHMGCTLARESTTCSVGPKPVGEAVAVSMAWILHPTGVGTVCSMDHGVCALYTGSSMGERRGNCELNPALHYRLALHHSSGATGPDEFNTPAINCWTAQEVWAGLWPTPTNSFLAAKNQNDWKHFLLDKIHSTFWDKVFHSYIKSWMRKTFSA